jgi:hypothetical protein
VLADLDEKLEVVKTDVEGIGIATLDFVRVPTVLYSIS